MGRCTKTATAEAVGRALRVERRAKGYSQESFAARSGLDRSYIAAIERGELDVSLETLTKLANGLETTVAALSCRGRAYALPASEWATARRRCSAQRR
jgi:transcriptional regulator with XRE-family HTH domain